MGMSAGGAGGGICSEAEGAVEERKGGARIVMKRDRRVRRWRKGRAERKKGDREKTELHYSPINVLSETSGLSRNEMRNKKKRGSVLVVVHKDEAGGKRVTGARTHILLLLQRPLELPAHLPPA